MSSKSYMSGKSQQAWAIFNANRAGSEVQISEARPFCLVCNKKSPYRTINFQWNRQNNEKVSVNSKDYREHQRTCDISIMFIYLMVSKLIYLFMDKETNNCLH